MDNTKTVEARVLKVIAEQLGVPEESLSPELEIIDGLCADSIDTIELCMGMEDELEIHIPYQAFEDCNTVGDLLALAGSLVKV